MDIGKSPVFVLNPMLGNTSFRKIETNQLFQLNTGKALLCLTILIPRFRDVECTASYALRRYWFSGVVRFIGLHELR